MASLLQGGARYLWEIHQRIDEDIKEPDRTWFALAAYNIGYGHLQDARQITEFHSADPNQWADVKRYLPLLEKGMVSIYPLWKSTSVMNRFSMFKIFAILEIY